MRSPPVISATAGRLAIGSALAFASGIAGLAVSIFWMTSVFLPLGIGGIVGSWLLFEYAMERIAADNNAGRRDQ